MYAVLFRVKSFQVPVWQYSSFVVGSRLFSTGTRPSVDRRLLRKIECDWSSDEIVLYFAENGRFAAKPSVFRVAMKTCWRKHRDIGAVTEIWRRTAAFMQCAADGCDEYLAILCESDALEECFSAVRRMQSYGLRTEASTMTHLAKAMTRRRADHCTALSVSALRALIDDCGVELDAKLKTALLDLCAKRRDVVSAQQLVWENSGEVNGFHLAALMKVYAKCRVGAEAIGRLEAFRVHSGFPMTVQFAVSLAGALANAGQFEEALNLLKAQSADVSGAKCHVLFCKMLSCVGDAKAKRLLFDEMKALALARRSADGSDRALDRLASATVALSSETGHWTQSCEPLRECLALTAASSWLHSATQWRNCGSTNSRRTVFQADLHRSSHEFAVFALRYLFAVADTSEMRRTLDAANGTDIRLVVGRRKHSSDGSQKALRHTAASELLSWHWPIRCKSAPTNDGVLLLNAKDVATFLAANTEANDFCSRNIPFEVQTTPAIEHINK